MLHRSQTPLTVPCPVCEGFGGFHKRDGTTCSTVNCTNERVVCPYCDGKKNVIRTW